MHAWCLETILITNCYIFGSNEGIICVLGTLKINHTLFPWKRPPPIVNKAALQLQLFSKMRKVSKHQVNCSNLLENLPSEEY